MASEAEKHHVHKVDDPFVEVRRLQVDVPQVYRHVNALDGPEAARR
ncbi:hypothetical protein AA0116_g13452 [Alternaria tenuissima]|nr:hypothetical protein AA0116_g13452 [Alternaria tenuissima]